MKFPSFGDADAYMAFGGSCAEYLSGAVNPLASCFNGIRPVGIITYYAIPFLLSSDPVNIVYITMFLNSVMLAILLWSGISLIKRFTIASHVLGGNLGANGFGRAVAIFVFFSLMMTIGFVPLRLADHQSLALFMACIALLASNNGIPKKSTALLAGILGGMAVLFRQNYALALVFLLISWALVFSRREFKQSLAPAICFVIGASVSLIQILVVYAHTGIPWLYIPAAMEAYASGNRQPYVELLAYSLPQQGAYLTRLAGPVSDFAFFSTKFTQVLLKFYWTPYLGEIPLHKSPEVLNSTPVALIWNQFIFVLFAIFSFASIVLKEKWLTILVLTAFLSTVVETALGHVEFRYFLFLRFAYLIYAIVIVCKIAVIVDRWRASPVGISTPVVSSGS